MKDEYKTKERLINELVEMRQRVAELKALVLDDKYRAADTERKQVEEALQEAQQHLRSVIEAAPLLLWAVDSNGLITLSEGQGLEALRRGVYHVKEGVQIHRTGNSSHHRHARAGSLRQRER